MDDDADFTLKLLNQLSGPAKKMASDIRMLERELHKLDRAAAAARGPTALKRFDMTAQLRQLHQHESLLRDNRTQLLRIGQATPLLGNFASAFAGPAAAVAALFVGFRAVVGLIRTAIDLTFRLATGFGRAAFEAAKFSQSAIASLGRLTSDALLAEASFDSVRKEAAELGLEVNATIDGFQKLLAAQFSVGKSREILRMGADLRAVNIQGEQVQRLLLAISQIKSKGRLQSEELLQLQEAGFSRELVFGELEKTLGKSRDEIQKLLERGKIGGDVAVEAILTSSLALTGASKLGEAGRQAAEETIAGMQATATAKLQNLMIDIGREITPVIQPLAKRVFGLVETILQNPTVQNLGKFLANRLEIFALWVEANWPQIQATIIGGVELASDAIRIGANIIERLAANWELLEPAIMPSVVALGLFVGNTLRIVDGILTVMDQLRALRRGFFEIGGDLIQGLIDGVSSRVQPLVDTVTEIANTVKGAFRFRLRLFSPSKVFEEYGAATVDGYVRGIAANDNAAMAATRELASQARHGVELDDTEPTLHRVSASASIATDLQTVDLDGASGRDVSVTFGDIIIQGGDGTTDQADAFVERVRPIVRQAVIDAIAEAG